MARTTAAAERPAPTPWPSRRRTTLPGGSRSGPSARRHESTKTPRAATAHRPACRSDPRSYRVTGRIAGSGKCKIPCIPSRTARRRRSSPAGGMGLVSFRSDGSPDSIGARVRSSANYKRTSCRGRPLSAAAAAARSTSSSSINPSSTSCRAAAIIVAKQD